MSRRLRRSLFFQARAASRFSCCSLALRVKSRAGRMGGRFCRRLQAARLGGQAGAAAKRAQGLLLQLEMVEKLDAAAGGEAQAELLAGGEGLGVADQLLLGDDADLRGGEVLLVGLAEPQGAQAHGVDAADALIEVAGDDRRRSLGAGAQKAAKEGVELAATRSASRPWR